MKGLRWWRRARGLTLVELGEASGVAYSHLAKIERDEVIEPRPDTLRRLADALGVEVVYLFFGEASIGMFGPPDRDITDVSPRTGDSATQPPTDQQPTTTGRTNV